jgi:hypothetical protein
MHVAARSAWSGSVGEISYSYHQRFGLFRTVPFGRNCKFAVGISTRRTVLRAIILVHIDAVKRTPAHVGSLSQLTSIQNRGIINIFNYLRDFHAERRAPTN